MVTCWHRPQLGIIVIIIIIILTADLSHLFYYMTRVVNTVCYFQSPLCRSSYLVSMFFITAINCGYRQRNFEHICPSLIICCLMCLCIFSDFNSELIYFHMSRDILSLYMYIAISHYRYL